ncbi:MAG: DUF2892 domain-containing protein [Nitrospirae bacterium]|nr:DUF2892 domain-containing protein [Nitrospirota bacterium]
MERNVGIVDSTIRTILGIIFLGIGFFSQLGTGPKIGAYAIGAIALATSFIRFCPLWKALGISTSEKGKSEGAENPVEKAAQQQDKTEEGQGKPAGH